MLKKEELKEELNRIKGLVQNIEGKIEALKLEKEDKFAELKEGHKNGEVIEFFSMLTKKWTVVLGEPLWISDFEYRIKPEEEKPKIGDVCKFWNDNENEFVISKIRRVYDDGFYTLENIYYFNAKTLTKQEAIELLFGKEEKNG